MGRVRFRDWVRFRFNARIRVSVRCRVRFRSSVTVRVRGRVRVSDRFKFRATFKVSVRDRVMIRVRDGGRVRFRVRDRFIVRGLGIGLAGGCVQGVMASAHLPRGEGPCPPPLNWVPDASFSPHPLPTPLPCTTSAWRASAPGVGAQRE